MKLRLFLATLLLAAQADAVLPTCSQVCSEQQFLTDPFALDTWTAFNDGAGCPITWDSTNNRIQRTFGTNCDNTPAYVRYNGNIAQDGCFIFKITANNNGAGSPDWRIGPVFRHQSAADTLATSPADPRYSVIKCDDGMTCNLLRWFTDLSLDVFQNQEVNGFGPLAVNDWLGTCVSGHAREGEVVKVYRWAADPGAPTDRDTWGTPDATATFSNSCLSPFGCDDYGNFYGVGLQAGLPVSGGVVSFSNFRTYSCQGL